VAAEHFDPAKQLSFADTWFGVPTLAGAIVREPFGDFYYVHVEIDRANTSQAPSFVGVSLCGFKGN